MASAYNKFYCFVEDLAEHKHNFATDTLKIMLTNSAPVATNTVKANITDISAGSGYSAGGTAITPVSSAQTTGLYKIIGTHPGFTASGGPIGPFRYAVMYNDTATNDELIAWWDYGSNITLADGESVAVTLDGTNGIFTIQ